MNLSYGSIEDNILLQKKITNTQRKFKVSSSRSSWVFSTDRFIIISSFLILGLVTYSFLGSVLKFDHSSSSSSLSSSNNNNENNDKGSFNYLNDDSFVSPISFDYIVVGAGPAGIITAVNLARRLDGDESKVLLLESGTLSQSSVLRELERLKNRNRDSKTNYHNLEDLNSTIYNGSHNSDDEVIPVYSSNLKDLNQFDIPFLWNELSQVHEVEVDSSSLYYSLHHWPIKQTLLGRAIGGSGVHNAM